MALTRRQKQVLDFLAKFINHHGYSPSFEEIGESLGLSSLATVHKHVQNLERKGFIRRGYNQSRSIDVIAMLGPVPFGKAAGRGLATHGTARNLSAPQRLESSKPALEFPLLGRIAAGRPVEAISSAETFSLGEFVPPQGDIFVLKVKGDSMVDDHICDGDYILVQRADSASNGEIVVALIGGAEATLKRFFREPNGGVRLQPANSQMDPIFLPLGSIQVQGRVIGVLRKY
ncbi:MAG: transcriptional repressor LexA [Terriglobia bacterium]